MTFKTVLVTFTATLISAAAIAEAPKGTVKVNATFVAYPEALIQELQSKDITSPLGIEDLA